MKQYNRFMEIFWLALAFISAITGAYMSFEFGIEESWYIFLFTAMALVQWLLRFAYRRRTKK